MEELRQVRKQLAHRKRRILFNNDGCDVTYYCKESAPEGLLRVRTTPLLGTQVDTIIYNTSSSFGLFRHRTKIGQIFTCKAKSFKNNKTQDFVRQGTDALEIMVNFCHRHGLECFWSMRMNDIHDSYKTWYAPYIYSKLKRAHPGWLMGSPDDRPKRGGMWSAVDYGRQEVRDYAYRFFEEVCENYDVDGVEMDFCRQTTFFRNPAVDRDATQEDRDKMTELLRRIRGMTERVGLQRGRPILVSVRVPDSEGYCEAVGLDIARWMAEDLIDILVVGGDFRLNPWETSVALGHRCDVPVYPCLTAPAMRDMEARKVRCHLDCWRGRAQVAWDAGVDGVYVFNFFNPRSPLWREIGDPRTLATLSAAYCVSPVSVQGASRFLAHGERFLTLSPLLPERPWPLKPGHSVSVELRVGGTVANGAVNAATLQLRVKDIARTADLAVKINGKPLAGGTPSKIWTEYSVDATWLKRGVNRLDIALQPGASRSAVLEDVILWVQRHKVR